LIGGAGRGREREKLPMGLDGERVEREDGDERAKKNIPGGV
jgi:hypothetical protein